MALDHPEFHPGYAALILVFLAACASLFKPKDDYAPLKLNQFTQYKGQQDWKNRGQFCLARVQYWTIRFIFYYAIPHVAIGLYLLTIALSIGISVSRINRNLHLNLSILRNDAIFCDNIDKQLTNDLTRISNDTQNWSDQLTWLLIAYFFQKMFGATLLVNGGGSVMIAAIVFDPWLFVSTFWGTNIENSILSIIDSESMNKCLTQWDNTHAIFNSLEQIIYAVNNVNICLWTMVAMSLSAGLLIDIVCTTIREFEYCLKKDLNEKDAVFNKINVIGTAVEKIDDLIDEQLENAGIKDDSSEEDENNGRTNTNPNSNYSK
eukprot:60885_1